jgi:TolB-like protein/class 3 adenylate cyclase/Tfp pilus assembly protein PilF
MAEGEKTKLRLEIAHVLFIDIVGYSKLRINQQSEMLRELNEIVSGTSEFREAESAGKLIRLPTGDGMALVFRTTPEAPAQCALEISRALGNHPNIHLRMGVHSGPVNEIADVNQRANVAGAGINIAQRVMDCGDAGHILLSKRVADDLEQYDQWRPLLHDLGTCEVKHGLRVGVVNLYAEGAGNPQLPKKLEVLRRHRLRVGWATGLTTLLLLAAIVGGFVIASQRFKRSLGSIPEKSIAVLPFENLSGDPENAYFADGIQEEILTRLSSIADLKVISRTSSQRYKAVPARLSEIAKQLGVAHIVEGAVQKTADQVRVNVQLIKAENDAHLWAETYDRKLNDIFSVESEIATRIAGRLQAKLTGAEKHALSLRPTNNSEAHQFYLKGRYYWNRRYEASLKKAAAYFEQAIAADPNYALAYAGLADSYALLGFQGYGAMSPTEALPKARAAAEKALQLDDSLGEAHASLANIKQGFDWDLVGAEKEYERAIELSPNYATAHHWYALHLAITQRFPECFVEIKRAQELDPFSLIINMNTGWFLYFARQYDEALTQCLKVLELDSNFPGIHWMLGQVYRQKGLHEKAIAEFQKVVQLASGDPVQLAVLGHAYAVAGKREEAQKTINELNEISQRRYVPAYFIALIYVGLDDKDQAFAWLEKAFVERSAGMVFIKVEPMFDPVRPDPRFQDLVRRVEAKGNLP